MTQDSSRRDLFRATFGSAMAAALAQQALAQQSSSSGIPTRKLGRTGEQVSILCLGGGHIGYVEDEALAIRIMQTAIDEGITFFDTAWGYRDGRSETLMGRALATGGRRNKVFLMTKNCERDYAGSMKCLEDSLQRLQTDHLDLWQFHEINYDNDPDWVFEKGGLKAALEARKAGKVRYIGFTGHKDPRIHLKMLNKPFEWDTSQMPINVLDAHYRSFQKEVVPVCLEKGVGVMGMKALGGGVPNALFPLGQEVSVEECLRFALSLPISTLVVGVMTIEHLQEAVAVARGFQPMSDADKSALLARLKPIATDGRHEQFKSTQRFDGAHHRRQHGFAT